MNGINSYGPILKPQMTPMAIPTEEQRQQLREMITAKDRKHSHYFKDVSHLEEVDVYRVLELFGVTDQAIGHAAKKLLVAGLRGVKNKEKDIKEAIDTLNRWVQMREEDKKENKHDANPTA